MNMCTMGKTTKISSSQLVNFVAQGGKWNADLFLRKTGMFW